MPDQFPPMTPDEVRSEENVGRLAIEAERLMNSIQSDSIALWRVLNRMSKMVGEDESDAYFKARMQALKTNEQYGDMKHLFD